MDPSERDTRSDAYAHRLLARESRWKRRLHLQAPFGWYLRRLDLGATLDVGCGFGRNLVHLGPRGVGVDHNPTVVAAARARGLEAWEVDAFWRSPRAQPGSFDALLFAHVLEHLAKAEASALVGRYLPLLRSQGRVVLITPQEAGQRADPSHLTFLDFAALGALLAEHGLVPERRSSFPLPRPFGRVLRYNEFVVVGRRP